MSGPLIGGGGSEVKSCIKTGDKVVHGEFSDCRGFVSDPVCQVETESLLVVGARIKVFKVGTGPESYMVR